MQVENEPRERDVREEADRQAQIDRLADAILTENLEAFLELAK